LALDRVAENNPCSPVRRYFARAAAGGGGGRFISFTKNLEPAEKIIV
jgi:hypothetical protein